MMCASVKRQNRIPLALLRNKKQSKEAVAWRQRIRSANEFVAEKTDEEEEVFLAEKRYTLFSVFIVLSCFSLLLDCFCIWELGLSFLLNPETRSDVIPVRLHFCETIPQARQLISHRRVCVNNRMVNIIHFKVSHGDIISFQENDARTRGEEIRIYIEILVEKCIGKFLGRPVRMWRRTKTEWFRKLKTKKECRQLLKYQVLRSSMQKEDTKKFGSKKVCLASYFDEHNK